jgi:HAMP domain-containing protein/HPt (histidine-containing phosphotransfer) domain-containing protein
MTIRTRLWLGFGSVVTIFGLCGGLILMNLHLLRSTDEHVRDRVSFNEIALEYRHAALDMTLGASQVAAGNVMGEQRIREGTQGTSKSRKLLEARLTSEAERRQLQELARVERLTVAAAERVVDLVRTKASHVLVQQELAFLSARSDALNLGLEALFDETREEVVQTMATSAQIGTRVQTQTIWALLASAAFSMLVSFAVFRSIARPLARLDDGVRKLSEGDLTHTIAVTSKDEIGKLTIAFNDMTGGLRRAMSALDARNQDMRVVLDHVHQGLLTMNRDGSVSQERSAVVEKWLGPLDAEAALWASCSRHDATFAQSLELAWGDVLEDVMPIELTLDQMPKKLRVGDRHLELEYRPIFADERLSKLLVVISDVSDRVAREKARAHEQEVMAIFQAIQRDKQGFLEFFAEGTELVEALDATRPCIDEVTRKREIHTLKGSSGMFGITSVAEACHALETAMADGMSPQEPMAQVAMRWEELAKVVANLAGASAAKIEIDDEEYTTLLHAVARGTPRRELARMVANWRMERVELRFQRLAEQARGLARRLDKGPLQVVVEPNGARLPRDTFASFWGAFVHAIRNALDHGLELPSEREAMGKPAAGTLTLSTSLEDAHLCIDVADDGRGIDWRRIAAKAKDAGLPHATEQDLVEALFSDGVSTADAVTDVSGRGVGMAALRDVCARLGGRIVIQSTLGIGTRISFRFPANVLSERTAVEIATLPFAATLPPGHGVGRATVSPPAH